VEAATSYFPTFFFRSTFSPLLFYFGATLTVAFGGGCGSFFWVVHFVSFKQSIAYIPN
jgi:hypothetical protein